MTVVISKSYGGYNRLVHRMKWSHDMTHKSMKNLFSKTILAFKKWSGWKRSNFRYSAIWFKNCKICKIKRRLFGNIEKILQRYGSAVWKMDVIFLLLVDSIKKIYQQRETVYDIKDEIMNVYLFTEKFIVSLSDSWKNSISIFIPSKRWGFRVLKM